MKKRYLFISPMFPEHQDEDVIVPFITHFCEQFANEPDIELHVMALMFPSTNQPYSFGNITVYPVNSGYKKSVLVIPYLIKAVFKGIKLQRQNKYDGILCFWYRECAFIGRMLNLIFSVKSLVWMLGQDIKKGNIYLRFLKIPQQRIIMMSAQQRDIFYENHKIYIEKIANVAVDKKRFPELNTAQRGIDILGAGNLSVLKNYSFFVAVIALLKWEFPDLRAEICGGDAGEKTALEEKIMQLGLQENVILTGTISHKEVLQKMNNAKIFLHTSKSEGGGTVLQEALYSGCYVTSTIPVEDWETMDRFYFSHEKEKLAAKIRAALLQKQTPQRVEKFSMEDSINVILDAFGE